MSRVKPDNSVWFEDAKLKNLVVCQPQNRNRLENVKEYESKPLAIRFNKIFGGFIMRQAFELAWANAHVFGENYSDKQNNTNVFSR